MGRIGVHWLLPFVAFATPALAAPAPAESRLSREAIEDARFDPAPTKDGSRSAMLLKAQVLLDRARFSPGVIDGFPGDNTRQAIAVYEERHGMAADGEIDEAVWSALTQADSEPVTQRYTITPDDVRGPFAEIPEKFEAMSKLDKLSYRNVVELLSEKFHMDSDLLRALNPKADFETAGTEIVVAKVGSDEPEMKAAAVEVDKSAKAVRAFDEAGALIAYYPASVGSEEKPAPDGDWEVASIAPNPAYFYRPDKYKFEGVKTDKPFKIAPGPNNPVGSVWIDLTKDTYGIHGTPTPDVVGKSFSHGCVRLTNWDVLELSRMVKKGVPVRFVSPRT
jgi:lipoprotein-anchoring transpeptidase ErfK/SrfK